MATRAPIIEGEWYHCYTRGVDKRTVFESAAEYERFLMQLYVSNNVNRIQISEYPKVLYPTMFTDERFERTEPLVDIGAYALMPTHVHLIVRSLQQGGIAAFMQKVFTGYTLYFNNKHGRTGALFSGTYKSKHITDDRYLKQVTPYVLLNPIELFEPSWKEGIADLKRVRAKLLTYTYSSLPDFFGHERLENKIVTNSLLDYYDRQPTLQEMLTTAQEYYREHSREV